MLNSVARHIRVVLAFLVMATLAGCGGSSGGSPAAQTDTGVFKDSNVSGMSYVSGAQSGETGADGSFTYEVGQMVTFSVGGVTVGNAAGAPVVTPLDLVPGASSSSTEVVNIVRFLLMLDQDGDPTNGITISAAVLSIADNWSAVDFATSDLAADLVSIISDAASADGGLHNLPNIVAAQAHLESTLLCAVAGAYQGTFTGDDTGPFGILVDALTGIVGGVAFSTEDQELLALVGTAAVEPGQTSAFISGDTNTGSTFSGNFDGADGVSGTWASTIFNTSGSFSGSRIGGDPQAVHRFTGAFVGGANGLFTFDVDANGAVTGVAYTATSLDEPGFLVDETTTLSGTVTGNVLSATTADGDATIAGTLNLDTGTLTGTWSDMSNNSGTFAGSGCRLN